MVKILVNRNRPIRFSEKSEIKYRFHQNNEITAKVETFAVDDIMFLEVPTKPIKFYEFLEIILNRGLVPLDIYSARALYERSEAMWELQNLWNRSFLNQKTETRLSAISFLGTVVSIDDNNFTHFPCYKYHQNNQPKFTITEDRICKNDQDFILIFKKEFIENLNL